MRLRSHQFVFLLLLACCVQVGDECASHLLQGGLYGSASTAIASRETAQPASQSALRFGSLSSLAVAALLLDPASAAWHRTVWQVRGPALESSAVSSFTGFLRA